MDNTPPRLTLPTSSPARKDIQIVAGFIRYFPAAMVEVAKVSKAGNDQHNPGQPMHWARGKSMDHEECIVRHLIDSGDLEAVLVRGQSELVAEAGDDAVKEAIIREKAYRAWRSLADLQIACEQLLGAPMAPAAKEAT